MQYQINDICNQLFGKKSEFVVFFCIYVKWQYGEEYAVHELIDMSKRAPHAQLTEKFKQKRFRDGAFRVF